MKMNVYKKINALFKMYKIYITSSTFQAVNIWIVRINVDNNAFWTGS